MRSRIIWSCPVSAVGGIELDPDVEHRALHRVPSHAAVAVPGQVGQSAGGAGHLDDDTVPVEAIVGIAEIVATQRGDGEEAGVGTKRGDPGDSSLR